jgi:hypothetical protein
MTVSTSVDAASLILCSGVSESLATKIHVSLSVLKTVFLKASAFVPVGASMSLTEHTDIVGTGSLR